MNKARLFSLLACLTIAVFVGACDTDRTVDTRTSVTPTPTTGAMNVRVADITGNMDNYVGKTVTVVADVEEVRNSRAFRLDEDSALTGGIDNDLWVLSPQAGNLANIDDQWMNNKVRVSGVVRRFAVADIEREIGWDLDSQLETVFSGSKPVLVASSIERVQ